VSYDLLNQQPAEKVIGARGYRAAVPARSELTATGPDATPSEPNGQPAQRTRTSGARAGVLLAGASLLATVANYVFLLAAGRLLGSSDYGALAALLGFLTVVLLPTGALQLAVSREVSRLIATGDRTAADGFAYAVIRLGLIATAPLVALALVLVVPVAEVLKIDSTAAVALTALGLVVTFVFPIATGVLQGHQRFHALAAMYVVPFALRLVLLALVAWAGFRLGGAVYAAVASGIVATVAALMLIYEPLKRGLRTRRPDLRPFLRYLGPVVLGLIGIAILTNIDVLVVKARFSADAAGDYAAAGAFARIAFFLPATVLAVLFPRTAARQARGEDTADILGRSLLVTAAFCALLTLFYGLAGRGLVHTSFGAEFAEGGELLVPFAVAMSLYALANILAGFHLSRAETRYAWILVAGVPLQIVALALVPGGVEGLVWTNVAVGLSLLAAHELFVGSSLPALRAGARHLAQQVPLRASAAVEAVLALLVATTFACLLTWPLAPNLGSSFIGSIGADASGTIWWLAHIERVGYHLFGTTTDQILAAPFGLEEENGLNLQWLFPYYPAYLATKLFGEVVAFNLVVISGLVFPGIAMYGLTRFLRCSRLVSAWAGVAFMVFPAHLVRIEHASLLHIEVLVLAVLAVVAAAERPNGVRLLLVGGATLAAWLTSGYFGAMASIAVVAFAVAAAWTAPERRARLRLAVGASSAALIATVAFGSAAGFAGADTGRSLERQVTDLSIFGLRPTELVVPPSENQVFGAWLRGYHETRSHGSTPAEASNYLGILTVVLAGAWLGIAWRRRKLLSPRIRSATVGLVAVALVCLLFAAPSPVGVLGHDWHWTPARLLYEVIPAFRVNSRWVAMLMTAVVPLAALGLQEVVAWVHGRSGHGTVGRLVPLGVGAAAIVVSFAELTIPLPEASSTTALPAQYTAVSRAREGILAEYPLRPSDVAAFWQREHGRPLLNGAVGGTYAGNVSDALVDPDAPGTAEKLALLGVTAIVTRADALDFALSEPRDVPNASWGPGYALLGRYADGSSVWRVTATPAPALTSLPRDSFDLGRVHPDGFVGHPLTGQTGVLELSSRTPQVVRLNFVAAPAGTTERLRVSGATGAHTIELAGRTPVSLTLRVPAGRSRLALRIDPAQAPGLYPLEISAPWTQRAEGSPRLIAEPVEDTVRG
jgi:O-antigen/teichoic acid export membrane protein